MSSEVEDSYSSTDVDVVVQEYRDKIQVQLKIYSKNERVVKNFTFLFIFFKVKELSGCVCVKRV